MKDIALINGTCFGRYESSHNYKGSKSCGLSRDVDRR